MKVIEGIEWRPIAFVDQLVREIQSGTKTKTRRIVRGVPYWDHQTGVLETTRPIMNWALSDCYVDDDGQAWLDVQTDVDDNSHEELTCPYGKPGDGLWVRECFSTHRVVDYAAGDSTWVMMPSKIEDADFVVFRDGSVKWHPDNGFQSITRVQVERMASAKVAEFKFRPPMHLPFWAHRLKLKVTSVGIERLQEITEAEAVAEGFRPRDIEGFEFLKVPALEEFISKWDQINGNRLDKASGKYLTWELDPFVWVIGFERIS